MKKVIIEIDNKGECKIMGEKVKKKESVILNDVEILGIIDFAKHCVLHTLFLKRKK